MYDSLLLPLEHRAVVRACAARVSGALSRVRPGSIMPSVRKALEQHRKAFRMLSRMHIEEDDEDGNEVDRDDHDSSRKTKDAGDVGDVAAIAGSHPIAL